MIITISTNYIVLLYDKIRNHLKLIIMQTSNQFKKVFFMGSCFFVLVLITAWQNGNSVIKAPINNVDTTGPIKTKNRVYNATEIDKSLKEVEKALASLDKEMQNINYAKIQKEVDEAMSKIKEIDVKKLEIDINQSLKKIDWKKIKAEINKALAEAEKKSNHSFSGEELSKTLNNLSVQLNDKNFNIKLNGKELSSTIEKSLKVAKKSMEQSQKQLLAMKKLIEALEKDELIDTKKEFSIKIEDDKLWINGKLQPNELFIKYKNYYYKKAINITNESIE